MSDELPNEHSYHHGNVKQALINAAMNLMESESAEQLSLRRLAKEVGVSPSAVYNHFPDKQALMLAVKQRAFAAFNDYFDEACTENEPEAALVQMCHAYYDFSRKYPTRFAVLFSTAFPLPPKSDEESMRVIGKTVHRLRTVMMGICQKYRLRCTETKMVQSCVLAWSQLHGLVLLRDSGSIQSAFSGDGWPSSCALKHEEDMAQFIQVLVDRLVAGIVHGQCEQQGIQ